MIGPEPVLHNNLKTVARGPRAVIYVARKRAYSIAKKATKQIAKNLLIRSPSWMRSATLAVLPEDSSIGRTFIFKSFHIDPVAAQAAYKQFNAGTVDLDDNYDRKLIQRSVDFGYVSWARKIQPYVQGRSILDVGCGTGLHGIGYVIAGAKSYTGLDPKIKLDKDWAKNSRSGHYEHFGATPREIMERMPRIRFIPGTFENIAPNQMFDLIVLHNVTEHLLEIESVFEGIHERLHPSGRLLYHHHNFYCWNGHHLPPRTVDKIDESDPAQRELMDWNHLTFNPPENHYISYGLNKIRPDDLKSLTERLFEIEVWDEIMPTKNEGLGRLTPEILARHAQYTERELNVKNVLCVARHKGAQGAFARPRNRKGAQDVPERPKKKPSSRERDMRRDEIFMSFYERCNAHTMTSLERLYGLHRAVEYLQRHGIEGDVVECGVWRGGSTMMAALSLMHFCGVERDLYLFDTFQGMPEPTEEDYKFGEGSAHAKWRELRQDKGSKWNYAPIEEVREAMLSTGYPAERIHLVPGMVEETLPGQAPARIALLRLDTDFYASTMHEYVHLYPRLVRHGVLIIDDFGTWAGSAQATQEYFAQNGVTMLLNRLDPGGRIGVKVEPAE